MISDLCQPSIRLTVRSSLEKYAPVVALDFCLRGDGREEGNRSS